MHGLTLIFLAEKIVSQHEPVQERVEPVLGTSCSAPESEETDAGELWKSEAGFVGDGGGAEHPSRGRGVTCFEHMGASV